MTCFHPPVSICIIPAWLYLIWFHPPVPASRSLSVCISTPAPPSISPTPTPDDGDCTTLGEDGAEVPSIAQSLPHSECHRAESECNTTPPSCHTLDPARVSCKRRRARAAHSQASHASFSRSLRPPVSPNSPSPPLCPLGAAHECGGGLEESWFITPPPCFTAEGATAEASPMEDLLIEHPSMSVYVSSSNLEQSTAEVADGTRMSESMPSPVPTRLARGSACQAAPLAKVTHASRVQKAKSRVERRHLARGRVQRQNRVRQQVPRHTTHTRNAFLHQPCQRGLCH
ncbi:tumor protein p53-inducible nuclear protein 2 isoform X2 [Trichomycterus rosablanca]|uniref:tumor protein p53-inducible nuclear protein 2 isoform X2 n=1 Tax=Trichomycterus rosablanca TaxID=2290929 RepID=UPI002F359660